VGERCYHQFCGVAKALDRVGERWTLLIVRDLLLGGRRFSDLLAAMPGLTPNLLSRRLKQMQESGIIERQRLPAPHGTTLYALTEIGRELEAVVLALGRFGSRWLTTPGAEDRLDPRWAMVSMMRRYKGCPRSWRVGLLMDRLSFTVEIGGEGAKIRDGAPSDPDLVLRGELPGIAALVVRGESARGLIERGLISREGPARVLADFVRAFGLRP